jgi:hypothetical protein
VSCDDEAEDDVEDDDDVEDEELGFWKNEKKSVLSFWCWTRVHRNSIRKFVFAR